jgi:hypothetical protein
MDRFDISTRIGGRDVLASGSVVVAPGEHLEINFGPDRRIRILFEQEKSAGYRMESRLEGTDLLTLTLFNFNNPMGIAPLQPLPIEESADGALFLSYVVHSIGSDNAATRLFSYSVSMARGGAPAT